jgi:hypothetical protein
MNYKKYVTKYTTVNQIGLIDGTLMGLVENAREEDPGMEFVSHALTFAGNGFVLTAVFGLGEITEYEITAMRLEREQRQQVAERHQKLTAIANVAYTSDRPVLLAIRDLIESIRKKSPTYIMPAGMLERLMEGYRDHSLKAETEECTLDITEMRDYATKFFPTEFAEFTNNHA